jgi:hypothetical protein
MAVKIAVLTEVYDFFCSSARTINGLPTHSEPAKPSSPRDSQILTVPRTALIISRRASAATPTSSESSNRGSLISELVSKVNHFCISFFNRHSKYIDGQKNE